MHHTLILLFKSILSPHLKVPRALFLNVQYRATSTATIITSVSQKRCSKIRSLTHAPYIWHFKLSSFFALFLFSSRNPQVADIYGFLLDHWLLHGVHMVMFNHVLLVFLPFLFNFSNFFSSSSKHKNVRLLLVLIIMGHIKMRIKWSI